MKAKDKLRTATIRMLLAAIQSEEVSGKQARELGDDEILKVLAGRRESAASGRDLHAERPRRACRRGTCRSADHRRLPADSFERRRGCGRGRYGHRAGGRDLGERPSMKQMGQVMKAATEIAGGKADGARLSAAVRDRL